MEREVINDDLEVCCPLPDIDIPSCDLWTFLHNRMKQFPCQTAFLNPVNLNKITYKELCDTSDVIGSNLLAVGFDVNKPFVLCVTNCIEFATTVLAVWRIGGKCALFSPLLKQGEIKRQLIQLEAEYILTNKNTLSNVKEAILEMNNMNIISIEECEGCLQYSDLSKPSKGINSTINNMNKKIDLLSTVLIPFSSGSTGLPKAVELNHSHIVKGMEVYGNLLNMKFMQGDYFLVNQPMAHMWTLLLLLIHMSHGKTSIIMTVSNLEEYFAWVHKYKVHRLYMTPSAAVYMVKNKMGEKYSFSHIELIHISAAPLSTEVEKQLEQIIEPNGKVTKGHGTTEMLMCLVVPYHHNEEKYESVGWPITNAKAKVIDIDSGVNLGHNKSGEICIKSDHHFKGYIGNKEATTEVMDKDGWYHTGDYGYYDDRGCFYIIDRLKELIKVEGYQVSPSEIESVLITHPSVLDVAVTPIPDEEAGEFPHAWIITKPGVIATEKELQEYVIGKLSKLKALRGGVRFVNSIPKAANGKLLRKVIKEETRASMKTK